MVPKKSKSSSLALPIPVRFPFPKGPITHLKAESQDDLSAKLPLDDQIPTER